MFTEQSRQISRRPQLFYKRNCLPCQWMSRLVILCSLGIIRRVAIDSAEAHAFYQGFPEHEGQLVLVERHRVTFGRLVFAAIPQAVLMAGWTLLLNIIRLRPTAT
ncbi:MAG: hypothetical protein MJA27_31905 [Pseudanabaenales cyanobacterium]|nr:hypothetical protein [Pseudanabaenales cyanobacterium]